MDSIWPLSVQSDRDDPQDTGPKGGGFDEPGRGPGENGPPGSESGDRDRPSAD